MQMKGPQDIRREKEYNLVPDAVHRSNDFDSDSKYLRQIGALKEENEFLRSLANRVQIELKEYQIRFPQLLAEDIETINGNKETPNGDMNDIPPWISSSKYMSPLLTAYDQRIKELNAEIKGYQQNALQIKKESNALIARNEELENELQTKLVSLYKKLKIKNKHLGSDQAQNEEEEMSEYDLNEYQQRVNILSQQNKLLRETEIRLKNEKEKYLVIINENKQNIHLLQAELDKVNLINSEFEEVSKNLNYENTELKQINNELKNNVVSKLSEKMSFLENRLKSESSELCEVKKRCSEYENEYNSLNNIHSKTDEQLRSTETENSELRQKIEALNDEISEYVSASTANKKKLSSMTESLESIENILQIYKNKEMEYLKQINDIKQANELFVNMEKDKMMNEAAVQLEQIQNLQQQKRQMLEDLHKENKQNINELNEKFMQKEQSLNESVNELLAKNAQLSEECTQFETKYNVIAEDMDKLKKMYVDKFEALKQSENELNDLTGLFSPGTAELLVDTPKKVNNEQKNSDTM